MNSLISIVFSCLYLINTSLAVPHTPTPFPEINSTNEAKVIPFKVPVSLIVMSQCPDAKECEKAIDESLGSIGDKIAVDVGYMGKLNASTRYGVSCVHGDKECEGNIQQLCYRARFPFFKDWWSFIQCQISNPLGLKHIGSKALLEQCTQKTHPHNYKYEDDRFLKTCINGPLGRHLLYHSVLENDVPDSHGACRILINHRPICKNKFSQVNCTARHQHNSTNIINVIENEYKLANLI